LYDECYSRNASCALKLISTFLSFVYYTGKTFLKIPRGNQPDNTMAKRKGTNNDIHNITQRTKDCATQTPLKTEEELKCSRSVSSSCSTSYTRRMIVKRHEHYLIWKCCWTPVLCKEINTNNMNKIWLLINQKGDYSVLYKSAVHMVMFQGWCYNHTHKTREWPHLFNNDFFLMFVYQARKVNDHVYVWKATITYMCERQRSRICVKVNDHVYVWKSTITYMCESQWSRIKEFPVFPTFVLYFSLVYR
jgi:hypothetical protein